MATLQIPDFFSVLQGLSCHLLSSSPAASQPTEFENYTGPTDRNTRLQPFLMPDDYYAFFDRPQIQYGVALKPVAATNKKCLLFSWTCYLLRSRITTIATSARRGLLLPADRVTYLKSQG
jgi:hypothetical protein